MIAMEMTNEEIAQGLFVNKRTIDTHRQNLINKLHVKNTAGLVKTAASLGATTMSILANGGVKGTTANAWSAGTTPYLGNRSAGDRTLNGLMLNFALFSVDPTSLVSTAP